MTAADLIKALEEMEPDAPVYFDTDQGGVPVQHVGPSRCGTMVILDGPLT